MKKIFFLVVSALIIAVCANLFGLKDKLRIIKQSLYIVDAFRNKFTGVLMTDEDGEEIFIDPKDSFVSYSIIQNGSWEPHIKNILRQIVKPKMKIVCLGGHIGVHERLISKLVGSEGHVFVFEPNPKILKFLKANIYFEGNKNVILYDKAAYSENKQLRFAARLVDKNSGGSYVIKDRGTADSMAEEVIVDAITLDSIPNIVSGVDIIQMDIEGSEPEAIYGAKKLIENSPNLIVLQEWLLDSMEKATLPEYIKFWRDRGYRFAEIVSSGDKLVKKTDEELMELTHSDVIIAKNLDEIIANFKPYSKP